MKLEITPTENFEFITLDEAKSQLRIDASFDDENERITGCIQAAQGAAESYMERSIVAETQVITLGAFQRSVCFSDWRPVVKNDVSVSILPFGETERVDLLPADFMVTKGDTGYRVIFNHDFAVDDADDAIVITVVCNIPVVIKQACLLKLADFYEVREDRPATNNGNFEKLLRPYRKY